MTVLSRPLPDEAATDAFAAQLAAALPPQRFAIALQGGLGAGKTRLVRGLLRALGERGPVPSPTYTLLESYSVAGRRLCHLDLYRLASPEELEFLGLREWLAEPIVLLVEWPERGAGFLPAFDLTVSLAIAGRDARRLDLEAASSAGEALLSRLAVGNA